MDDYQQGKVHIRCSIHIQAYVASIGGDTFGHAATSVVAAATLLMRWLSSILSNNLKMTIPLKLKTRVELNVTDTDEWL
jgi:hypothetical protein